MNGWLVLPQDQAQLVLMGAILSVMLGLWGIVWALFRRKGATWRSAMFVFWLSFGLLVLALVTALGIEIQR